MGFEIESMAIEMPEVAKHPNRVGFRGVLTFVDTPSDSAPAGARGHRVMLKRAATERAIPSLLGMGLDYAPSLDRHDARRKVGVITLAEITDKRYAGGPPRPSETHQRSLSLSVSGFRRMVCSTRSPCSVTPKPTRT